MAEQLFATLNTNRGAIRIELYPNHAPKTVANFVGLDVKLRQDLAALANEVKAVKHGTKSNPWQIDAIAGATVTSRAVGKAINDSAQLLLPKLLPQIEQLRKKES